MNCHTPAMPDRSSLSTLRSPFSDFSILRAALGWSAAKWLRFQRWREKRFGLSKPYQLFSRNCRHGLWVRPGTSDLDVFVQIYLQREYACLDASQDVQLVIDCGANVGYSSAWFLSRFPSCRVIAVEPDTGNFAQLARNVAAFGSRVQLVQSGVWSRRCSLVISEAPYRDGREWSVQVREAAESEPAHMTAVDIATLLAESGYATISILKIDIEAAERFVFAENYQAWIDRVDNLVIELHDDECRRVFFDAIRGLPFKVSQSGELTVCRWQGQRAASRAA